MGRKRAFILACITIIFPFCSLLETRFLFSPNIYMIKQGFMGFLLGVPLTAFHNFLAYSFIGSFSAFISEILGQSQKENIWFSSRKISLVVTILFFILNTRIWMSLWAISRVMGAFFIWLPIVALNILVIYLTSLFCMRGVFFIAGNLAKIIIIHLTIACLEDVATLYLPYFMA